MPHPAIFDRTSSFELSVATSRNIIEKFSQHRPLAGLKILDVGCRNGESVRALTDLGATAYGVDLAPRCIAHARSRFPELAERYFVGDLRQLPELPVADFDVVLCIGVLPYTPPEAWLPAIHGMAERCRPGGEVRVLLQRQKSRLLRFAVRRISALPEPVFAAAIAPAVTAVVWPLSRPLLGAAMSPAEIHYRVSLSLYGLHFGVPKELEPYEFPIEASEYVSPKLSRGFAIPAPAPAAWAK